MSNLAAVWEHVEKFVEQGFNLIPVREKAESINGREYGPKSAYDKWTKYQTERNTKSDLWDQVSRYDASCIAIICGAISGNLEVIDIDVKYNHGIDAILFSDIQRFYPELWPRLRIHKSPSGGYHILYRISDGIVPGNQKLAGRQKTEEELKAYPKPKEVNFLETRGEAGYVLAPPSMGYKVHQDVPVPLITWVESTRK